MAVSIETYDDGIETVVVITGVGTDVWHCPEGISLLQKVIVVAGGGGGGGGSVTGSWVSAGGGGGAGGIVIEEDYVTTPDTDYDVTIGDGGTAGAIESQGGDGEDSVFEDITADGGGGGAGNPSTPTGDSGGSAGGSIHWNAGGTSSDPSQGNDGGCAYSYYAASGGGGKGGVGDYSEDYYGGDGGVGIDSTVDYEDYPERIGGGGGGGCIDVWYGAGVAVDGGGDGGFGAAVGEDATDDTGGGGGGGGCDYTNTIPYAGGEGASGIIIIRYDNPIEATVHVSGEVSVLDIKYIFDVDTSVTVTPTAKFDGFIIPPIEATVHTVPIPPTTNIFISGNFQTAVNVAHNLTDKMMAGTFTFRHALNTVSEFYFMGISVDIPDYTGTPQNVFVGFFPSSQTNFTPKGDYESITAYDYAWYLTMNYLTLSQRTFLSSIQQLAKRKYQQYFVKNDGEYPVIKIGDIVVGEDSDAAGLVYEVNYAGADWFKMDNIVGTGYDGGSAYVLKDHVTLSGDGDTNMDNTTLPLLAAVRVTVETSALTSGGTLTIYGKDDYGGSINDTVSFDGTEIPGDYKTTSLAFKQVFYVHNSGIRSTLLGTLIVGEEGVVGEKLLVNGVNVAHSRAYGSSMDITGTITPMTPEDYIVDLLGGYDNYTRVTGIMPYRINSTSGIWGGTKPEKDFIFDEKTTKIMAIEDICKYLEFIFMVKSWGYMPHAYFVAEEDIDDPVNGLDLPAPVTVTKGAVTPDGAAFLLEPVVKESKGEERYNRVTVRCLGMNGVWYTSVKETDGLMNGDELPVEYQETNPDLASQEEVDQRCLDLFTYYSAQINSWKAVFVRRSDLRLLQILTFSGYGNQIPNGDYRIVGIEYDYDRGGVMNQQTCTLVADGQFKAYLNLNRIFTDTISEWRAVIQEEIDKLGKTEVGTVVGVDGDTLQVLTEQGIVKTVRKP